MAGAVACFDLDGTVLDPNGSIRDALDHAVQRGGFEAFHPDDVLIGMPLRDILRKRTQDGRRIEDMVDAFRNRYLDESWRLVDFYPGMRDTLAAVRDAGLATAVVTTKGEQEAVDVLQRLGADDLFDTIVGDDGVRPLKPDPAPVIAACGRLGHHPRDACMIGDTVYDIEAGRAAGAYTIGVTWGHGGHGSMGVRGCDAIVSDAVELREAVLSWAK